MYAQVWSAYKDQKHDLFLPSTAPSIAAAGGAGVAGFINNNPSSSSSIRGVTTCGSLTAPPPPPPPLLSRMPSTSSLTYSNGNDDIFHI